MNIIGIDPGSTRAGYGVISFDKTPTFVAGGIIETHSTDKNTLLAELYASCNDLLDTHKPDVAGVEKLYFAKNVRTATEVSQSRGVILLSLVQHNIAVEEVTPLAVKQGISGWGGATKKDVEKAVRQTLALDDFKDHDDVFDALAIALVVAYSLRTNYFIEKNIS